MGHPLQFVLKRPRTANALIGGVAKVSNFDAIILGAGATGLMAAIEAGKRGRRVVVLERSEVETIKTAAVCPIPAC